MEDRKIDRGFTKKAAKTEIIKGVTVYYAEADLSLRFEHNIYVIFEYEDVIYDIRVNSDDPQIIWQVVYSMLEEIE